jgi:hypothetical protein
MVPFQKMIHIFNFHFFVRNDFGRHQFEQALCVLRIE